MTTEKRKILDDINCKLKSRINSLLNILPNFHTIDDGFIVRLFTEWDYCDENSKIKYKIIKNIDNPEKKSYFFFVPKNTLLNYNKNLPIKYITCLTGELIIDTKKTLINIKPYTKIHVGLSEFSGCALDNTYLIGDCN